MFLIEPFTWMFTINNFQKHFFNLLITAAICWLSTFLLYIFSGGFFANENMLINFIIIIAEIILFLTPILCLTGYFWCLTDNIIDRDLEAKLDSVYNGKSDLKNVITLPEWDLPRFVWRGIASIFASIIMYVPFTIIMVLIVFNLSLLAAMMNLDPMQVTIATFIFVILFSLLIPGLLWNYARRDSVVAVLNIPKALYLMDCYSGKYFLNSLLIVIFSIIRSLLMRFIIFALGFGAVLNTYSSLTPANFNPSVFTDFAFVYIILLIIGYVVDSYWIFVNAYLLGTIAPPSEY